MIMLPSYFFPVSISQLHNLFSSIPKISSIGRAWTASAPGSRSRISHSPCGHTEDVRVYDGDGDGDDGDDDYGDGDDDDDDGDGDGDGDDDDDDGDDGDDGDGDGGGDDDSDDGDDGDGDGGEVMSTFSLL